MKVYDASVSAVSVHWASALLVLIAKLRTITMMNYASVTFASASMTVSR